MKVNFIFNLLMVLFLPLLLISCGDKSSDVDVEESPNEKIYRIAGASADKYDIRGFYEIGGNYNGKFLCVALEKQSDTYHFWLLDFYENRIIDEVVDTQKRNLSNYIGYGEYENYTLSGAGYNIYEANFGYLIDLDFYYKSIDNSKNAHYYKTFLLNKSDKLTLIREGEIGGPYNIYDWYNNSIAISLYEETTIMDSKGTIITSFPYSLNFFNLVEIYDYSKVIDLVEGTGIWPSPINNPIIIFKDYSKKVISKRVPIEQIQLWDGRCSSEILSTDEHYLLINLIITAYDGSKEVYKVRIDKQNETVEVVSPESLV